MTQGEVISDSPPAGTVSARATQMPWRSAALLIGMVSVAAWGGIGWVIFWLAAR